MSGFLSDMSHEMRAPINEIIGMTGIARKTTDEERRYYALNRIEGASKHLLEMVNDVLEMSKIEANKFDLAIVEFDLRKILNKAALFVRFIMDEKKHSFTININDNVPNHYFGDDQRFTQVITSFLFNAVKFTQEEGKIALDISLTGEGAGICELRFVLTGSGMGISAEQQKKIGTRFGLYFSKYIIRLMGGDTHVESEPGKGFKFIFTVKLLRRENDNDKEKTPVGKILEKLLI